MSGIKWFENRIGRVTLPQWLIYSIAALASINNYDDCFLSLKFGYAIIFFKNQYSLISSVGGRKGNICFYFLNIVVCWGCLYFLQMQQTSGSLDGQWYCNMLVGIVISPGGLFLFIFSKTSFIRLFFNLCTGVVLNRLFCGFLRVLFGSCSRHVRQLPKLYRSGLEQVSKKV